MCDRSWVNTCVGFFRDFSTEYINCSEIIWNFTKNVYRLDPKDSLRSSIMRFLYWILQRLLQKLFQAIYLNFFQRFPKNIFKNTANNFSRDLLVLFSYGLHQEIFQEWSTLIIFNNLLRNLRIPSMFSLNTFNDHLFMNFFLKTSRDSSRNAQINPSINILKIFFFWKLYKKNCMNHCTPHL